MDDIISSLALMLIWPSGPGFHFNLRDMYRSRHGPPSSSDFTDSGTSSRCRLKHWAILFDVGVSDVFPGCVLKPMPHSCPVFHSTTLLELWSTGCIDFGFFFVISSFSHFALCRWACTNIS
ncbi:hypothetical protein BDZ89DRAFT_1130316 [Hymenopellis radicata]|nr:hypothetical protein BDZ89DRAFT_1130316 [Hymenopellis radicata]